MLDFLETAVGALINALKPLRIKRDGSKHVVADPPMTRAEAVQWLWEGRANPPANAFRPDPVVGSANGPQRRFLCAVSPADFAKIRPEFLKRYFADGPGAPFAQQIKAVAPWMPDAVVAELLLLEEREEFRETLLPRVVTFPGTAPWGRIVVWVGFDDWGKLRIMEMFPYFPEDEAFYVNMVDSTRKGRLLTQVYRNFNRDLEYFVEGKRLSPTHAREEIKRINDAVFRLILEAFAGVVASGAGTGASNNIAASAESTVKAAQESFRNARRLFSLSARRAAPVVVVFRGTTYRWRLGDPSKRVHDLGEGIYFASTPDLAEQYARMAREGADVPIMLRGELAPEQMGKVLDLTSGEIGKLWDEFAAPILAIENVPFVNEQYYENALVPFLKKLGVVEEEFDVIIGHEYLRGGKQFRFRRGTRVYEDLLMGLEEFKLDP